jgi:diguanylate cyclase (GGDEF)-like protein
MTEADLLAAAKAATRPLLYLVLGLLSGILIGTGAPVAAAALLAVLLLPLLILESGTILRPIAVENSDHDALTGLPNRQAFYEHIDGALAVADREQFGVGLLYLDLDHFKDVNETYGHRAGDLIISEVTRRFGEVLRRGDKLFRLGGDEFALVVQGVDDITGAAIVAEKLAERMRRRFRVQGEELYVGLSIGIAWYPGDAGEPGELMRKSDEALSEAKKDRNTYRFYTSEIQSTAAHHVAIVNALRWGLELGEFSLAYQPIMGAASEVVGVEALLRWKTGEFDSISPEQFIPVAESSGFIQELGGWVLEEAAAKRADLAKKGFHGFLSVNISAYQLRSAAFIELVKSVIRRYRIKPGWLHFEITETSLMATEGVAIEVLRKLRSLGITLAIDDFGKGYSSLTYLRHLPVEMLKIDRSFILGILENAEDRSIIESVSSLASGLGLTVVAEGVETREHFDSVRKSMCDAFQGYLFSRPVSYDSFVTLLGRTA